MVVIFSFPRWPKPTGRPSIWWNHALSNVQAAALVR
jgi:hypothetical protein